MFNDLKDWLLSSSRARRMAEKNDILDRLQSIEQAQMRSDEELRNSIRATEIKINQILDLASDQYRENHSAKRALDLTSILWNWRTDRYQSHAQRWEWIDKANALFRSRTKVIPLTPTSVLCYALGRFWYKFDATLGLVQRRLMTEGSWELSLTEAMAHEVQPGMTVVDIGANIGYYSIIMADRVGPAGKVFICEPVPMLRANIEASIEINWFDDGRIQFCDRPLFSETGNEVYFVDPGDVKNAHIAVAPSDVPGHTSYKMTTIKLDDLIPSTTSVDVIKIDAEGAEYAIWLGMSDVIRRSPSLTVFLEFNAGRSYDAKAFLERIASDGLKIQNLDNLYGVVDVNVETLMTEKVGEDWMLYLSKRPDCDGFGVSIHA